MLTENNHTIKDHWLEINPRLHIDNEPFLLENSSSLEFTEKEIIEYKERFAEEGYISTNAIDWKGVSINLMSEAVSRLVNLRMSPLWCYVYDEFWIIHNKYAKILGAILGESSKRSVLRMGIIHIDPKNDNKLELKPHRDKGVKTTSIDENGLPKTISVWIPLTDTDQSHECNYILPKNLDPYYHNPSSDPFTNVQYNKPNNNEAITQNSINLHHVRSIPQKAGSILMMDQDVLSWIGKSGKWTKEPSIRIFQAFQRADIEPSENILIDLNIIPDFTSRLKIISNLLAFWRMAGKN